MGNRLSCCLILFAWYLDVSSYFRMRWELNELRYFRTCRELDKDKSSVTSKQE